VPPGSVAWPEFIDHRYFYSEFKSSSFGVGDYGNYTCGLVRDAVAGKLRAKEVDFADTDFLKSLPDYINNPSVTGFMIEQAVLSSIVSNGLAIGGGIGKPMRLIMFKDDIPQFRTDITDQPVLYCPRKFNFRNIDGIIVSVEPLQKRKKGNQAIHSEQKKRKLCMYPIQITLAPDTHSDSHRKFYDNFDKWTKDLKKEFDMASQFIWITPNSSALEEYNQFSQSSHSERYIHLSKVNQDIWKQYLRAKETKTTLEASP
jgi:hypothetical protein